MIDYNNMDTDLRIKRIGYHVVVLWTELPVLLLASERSERDTYRGNTIENRGFCLFIYLDICLDVCMSFCTLTLRIFVFAPRSTPSQTSLNRILWCSDHYPYHLRN